MKEIQPFELTDAGARAYSNDGGNNMSDGPGAGEIPPANSGGDGSPNIESTSRFSSLTTPEGRQGLREGRVFGKFFESRGEKAAKASENRFHGQADNPDARSVLQDIIKLKSTSPEVRNEAVEELARVNNMPVDDAQDKIDAVRDELSEVSGSEVRAQADSLPDDSKPNRPVFGKPETGRPPEDQIKEVMPSTDWQEVPGDLEVPDEAEDYEEKWEHGKKYVRWRENPPKVVIEYAERPRKNPETEEEDSGFFGGPDEDLKRDEDTTTETDGGGLDEPPETPPVPPSGESENDGSEGPTGAPPDEGPKPEDGTGGDGEDKAKAELMSRVEKVNLAKKALLKGKKEDEILDPATGKPLKGSADEILDYLDSILSETYKELADKFPDAFQEKESSEDFLRHLLLHLSNENVQEQLRSFRPEFTSTEGHKLKDGVDEFAQFIERIEIGPDLIQFAHIISRKTIDLSSYGERKNGKEEIVLPDGKTINLSSEARKLLFEWALNRVITIPLADEDSPYSLSLQHQNIRDELKAMAQTLFKDEGDREFHSRISGNAGVESTFHNVNITIASGGEKYQELFASLRTPSLGYVTNDMPAVSEVMSQLEMSFIEETSRDQKAMTIARTKRAFKDAEEKIRALYESGELKTEGRVINRWELDRAIRIGKTFFRASQRGAVYISAGNMEGESESFYDEFAVRRMAPSKTLWQRFWSPGEGAGKENKPAAKALYIKTIEKMGKQWDEIRKSVKKGKNGQTRAKGIGSLIGQTRDEMLRNYLGIFDLASHSGVRAPKLYLTPIKMENGPQGSISMYDYLKGKDMLEMSEAELKDIEMRVLGQTSYLSAINRHGALSTELRQKLWRKRAIIDPTTVASLRPEIIGKLAAGEMAVWEQIMPILDQHHILQLSDEKIKYSGVLTRAQMQEEAAKFSGEISLDTEKEDKNRDRIINDERFNALLDRLIDAQKGDDGSPLSPEAKAIRKDEMKKVLTKVICLGMEESEELAVITVDTKHNYAINDAPITAWFDEEEGLSDNNFVRNFGDQAKIAHGFETLGAVYDDIRSAVSGEPFDVAVKELAQVYGDQPARDIVQPSWQAFLEMASQYEFTKWNPLYFIHDKQGKPRSEFEKLVGRVGLFMNEFEKKAWLEARANKGTIENDLRKNKSERQLTKALKETGAGRRSVFFATIREDGLKVWPFAVSIAFILSIWELFKNAIAEGVKENA